MSNIGTLPLINQGLRVGSNGDLVLGQSLDDPYNKLSLVIGKNNQLTAYCDSTIVLGNNNTVQSGSQWPNANNVVIGQGCVITRNTGILVGGNNVVIGNNASVGSVNATSAYTNNNVVIGNGANVNGQAQTQVAIGNGVAVTGTGGVSINGGTVGNGVCVGGTGCSGSLALAIGATSSASNSYCCVINGGNSRTSTDFHVGAGSIANSQWGVVVVANNTTDATANVELFSWVALSSRYVLPNNSVTSFFGTLIARNTTNNTDAAVWYVQGVVIKQTTAASTLIIGTPTSTQIAVTSGASTWTYALSADTTNGSLKFAVTGQAATNIRWYIALHTTEVT